MKIRLAACTVEIWAEKGRLQLFPAGDFAARDGRPGKGRSWKINATSAQVLIEAAKRRLTPFVIDYEHQTLNSADNGKPAPAAGWFSRLAWIEGKGLFAVDVAWTEAAAAMIAVGEYKFISPVFSFAPDGTVTELHMAALTNYPAIDGMEMLAAAKFATTNKEDVMNKKFLKLLGLAEDADEAAALAALTALVKKTGEQEQAIAASKAKAPEKPDPAKFVPVETVAQIQGELAALKSQVHDRQADELVSAGLSEGRILPAMETWARELGQKDVAALKAFVDAAQPIAALSGTQTGGKKPAGGGDDVDEAARAVCKAMGVSEDDYKKYNPAP